MREDNEINDIVNACMEQNEKGGSRFPGMTYEQGVAAALDWMTGDTDDNPYPDE